MRAPLDELRSGVYDRIVADVSGGADRVFTLAPTGQARPYLELDEGTYGLDDMKNVREWTCLMTIRAHGNAPNASDAHSLLNAALSALDRQDPILSNDFTVDEAWLGGPIVVQKAADNVGVFFVASMTMRFRVRDTRAYT